ncbi:MAG TPA: serine/threonine-protein kinase, partial [Candidatus Nanopelagicales bacterium]|nr:serine/threonine-protein kinase [Candidatus Nanopelagicales bacterium]
MRTGQQVTPTIKLVRPLGQGAMGNVWVADHQGLGTQVAVKFIDAALSKDPEFSTRFRMEARAAAQLKSPHVAQVMGHGFSDEGEPFLVMELLEGETLHGRIQRLGPRPLTEVAKVIAQTAKALAQAHRFNVVHRDIKPENLVLLDIGGEPFVKVIDFGVTKHTGAEALRTTASGSLLGTPVYMSPEQIEDKPLDHRADLWSLAVVAYEALTARLPFRADSLGGLIMAVETGAFPRPSTLRRGLPDAVDAWMARALNRDPEARFTSARDLAETFEQAAGMTGRSSDAEIGSGVPSRPTARTVPPAPDSRTSLSSPPEWGGGGLGAMASERGPESRRFAPPSSEEPSRPRSPSIVPREAQEMQVKEGRIALVRGHIVKLGAEAIVCPTDERLTPGFDGVSQAIHRAAGPELAEMAARIGSTRQGNAEITGAGRLPP